MVEIQIAYSGNLRTELTHVPSGTEIETDAPTDNEGLGQRFSPTDLVAGALGSCILTIIGIAAKKRGFSIEGARARVVKHMLSAPARRIGRIEVEIHLPRALAEAERELAARIAEACPVRQSLSPDIQVEVRFATTD